MKRGSESQERKVYKKARSDGSYEVRYMREGLEMGDVFWKNCLHCIFINLLSHIFCVNAVVGLPRSAGKEETGAGFH